MATTLRIRRPVGLASGAASAMAMPALLALLLAASASAQAQQVFRIVGPDGKVTFSDRPAVSTGDRAAAASVVSAAPAAPSVDAATLPYELRLVAQRYPVTLYTAEACAPCADARNLLRARGVPFTEKTVSTPDDVEALGRISGGSSLPFATIGAQPLQGFASPEWMQYLDLAGYPKQSALPSNYRGPAASPLVAAAPVRAPARPAAGTDSPAPVPARPQAPAAPAANRSGIQF